jgi:hypothetical protein
MVSSVERERVDRAPVWALALVACLSGLGCGGGSTASGGTAEGGSDGAAEAAAGFGAGACGQCVFVACQDAIRTCESDPDCSKYLGCVDTCPTTASGEADPACVATCPHTMSDAGTLAEAQFDNCRLSGAGAMCPACGIDGGGGPNPIVHQTCTQMTGTSCSTCEDDYCCDTYAACAADPDCSGLDSCLTDCLAGNADDAGAPAGGASAGGSCEVICGNAHPAGLKDWAPREACLLVSCSAACGAPLTACLACQYQMCADEFASLYGTPDGYLLNGCRAACPAGTNACSDACLAQYPDIQGASQALSACLQLNCPTCM